MKKFDAIQLLGYCFCLGTLTNVAPLSAQQSLFAGPIPLIGGVTVAAGSGLYGYARYKLAHTKQLSQESKRRAELLHKAALWIMAAGSGTAAAGILNNWRTSKALAKNSPALPINPNVDQRASGSSQRKTPPASASTDRAPLTETQEALLTKIAQKFGGDTQNATQKISRIQALARGRKAKKEIKTRLSKLDEENVQKLRKDSLEYAQRGKKIQWDRSGTPTTPLTDYITNYTNVSETRRKTEENLKRIIAGAEEHQHATAKAKEIAAKTLTFIAEEKNQEKAYKAALYRSETAIGAEKDKLADEALVLLKKLDCTRALRMARTLRELLNEGINSDGAPLSQSDYESILNDELAFLADTVRYSTHQLPAEASIVNQEYTQLKAIVDSKLSSRQPAPHASAPTPAASTPGALSHGSLAEKSISQRNPELASQLFGKIAQAAGIQSALAQRTWTKFAKVTPKTPIKLDTPTAQDKTAFFDLLLDVKEYAKTHNSNPTDNGFTLMWELGRNAPTLSSVMVCTEPTYGGPGAVPSSLDQSTCRFCARNNNNNHYHPANPDRDQKLLASNGNNRDKDGGMVFRNFDKKYQLNKTHGLIVPREHIVNLNELTDTPQNRLIIGRMFDLMCETSKKYGNAYMHTNSGTSCHQTTMHMHWHFCSDEPDAQLSQLAGQQF